MNDIHSLTLVDINFLEVQPSSEHPNAPNDDGDYRKLDDGQHNDKYDPYFTKAVIQCIACVDEGAVCRGVITVCAGAVCRGAITVDWAGTGMTPWQWHRGSRTDRDQLKIEGYQTDQLRDEDQNQGGNGKRLHWRPFGQRGK